MTHKKSRLIIKTVSACLALAMALLCLSSCGLPKGVRAVKIDGITYTQAEYSSENNHFSNPENLVYVAKSGLLELYFDSTTYTVAVVDTSTQKTWYSLPEIGEKQDGCTAAAVGITVSKGGSVYYLNSQDNAVAFDSASFKPLDNGISITYDMALKSDIALKGFDKLGTDELYVSLTADYTLSDGTFYAEINCSKLLVSEGYTVEDIDFLNYFGASGEAQPDDCIFVPDASGALIKTGVEDSSGVSEMSFDVYGSDAALGESSNAQALLGCFGIKSGDNAFAAIILSGDTVATVTAERRNSEGGYNRVGASFKVGDVYYSKDSDAKKYTGQSYAGNIKICYRFLSGKNAGYVGMASACREVFIRNSVLSSEMLEPTEHLPFILTVQGAVSTKSAHKYMKLSTYEQTLELLELMKAKSINNIDIRYKGILTGADTQDILSKASPLGKLGNKKDFEELSSYVKTQKFNLFLDLNICTFNRKSASVGSKAAKMINGEHVEVPVQDGYTVLSAGRKTQMYSLSVTQISDTVLSFLNNRRNYEFDGYSINDAGTRLYSDYSHDVFSIDDTVSAVKQQSAVLANNHKIMVNRGNFYLLGSADEVVNIPSTTAYKQSNSYVSIPFVEMVLHGIVNYSLEPLNLQTDRKLAALKSVEYGASPSYEWVCTRVANEDFNSKYYYQDQLAGAAEDYKLADEILGDLVDARMTSHYQVQYGVYCTEYNNSTVIYFNYNSEPVTVNSISIPSMSCIRVN